MHRLKARRRTCQESVKEENASGKTGRRTHLGLWQGGGRTRVVYREAYVPGLEARRYTHAGNVQGGRRARAQGKEAELPGRCTGRKTRPGSVQEG